MTVATRTTARVLPVDGGLTVPLGHPALPGIGRAAVEPVLAREDRA